MKVIRSGSAEGAVYVGLAPGEMLLESIRKAIAEAGIRSGVVVSGVGTLRTCRIHFIQHSGFPPSDRFLTIERPLELVSLNGAIADGVPHLHVTVSCRDEAVWAGHLEDGTEVLYLAEVVILPSPGADLVRKPDPDRNINLLDEK